MSASDNQLMSIFSAALEHESELERSAYLDRACGGNALLRERVQALLRAHDGAGRFMESKFAEAPTPTGMDAPTVTEVSATKSPGALVAGRYQLLEVIGEGGMGTVWLADQTEPVRRRVALKLIKPGMDSREVVGRFEAERQALALMDHPNIAKVHDGGVTDEGRPYFVMELVRGIPVTEYCDRTRLGIRERLALFLQICQAVQHAHQKGIIHRDLKPSNILVAEPEHGTNGVVKVIDFGVAKAVGASLTDDPVHTRFMQMVGTPMFMSPEQAERRGLDVDTRADIYSLGVLLYELLTGTTPFDKKRFKEVGYDEVRRIIREEEPPKPSARLSTLSATDSTLSTDRGTDWRRLSRVCRGDLDWIVMKALEKDRSRRYETASAFAADIHRYLNNEPVLAGPPAAAYKVRKFVRRHRGKVVAASAFVVLLLAAVAGLTATLFAVDKERQRKEDALTRLTEQQEETNKALASQSRTLGQAASLLHVMSEDLVENIVSRQPQVGEAERALLRRFLVRVNNLAREPRDSTTAWLIQSDGQWIMGLIRERLGEHKEAEEAFRAALSFREHVLAESPTDPNIRRGVADCHIGLANQYLQTGRLREAEAEYGEAIAILTPVVNEFPQNLTACWLLARAYDRLGLVLRDMGCLADAEAAHWNALALEPRLSAHPAPKGPYDLDETYDHLGTLLRRTGRDKEAETAYRKGLAIREKQVTDFPNDHQARRKVAVSYQNLGILLFETGRGPEGEATYRKGLVIVRKLAADFPLVPQHREDLARGLAGLGTFLTQTNRARDAEEMVREALAIRVKLAADFDDVPNYRRFLATSHFDLGNVLWKTDRLKEAETEFRTAIEMQTKLVAESPDGAPIREELSRSQNNLGAVLTDLRRFEEAGKAYREAIELGKKLVADFPTVTDYAVGLGGTYCNLGNNCQFRNRLSEAPEWYDRAIAVLKPVVDNEPRLTKARVFLRNSHWGRAATLGRLKRHRESGPDWERAVELSLPQPPPQLLIDRAADLARGGEPEQATQSMEDVLAKKPPPGAVYDAACVFALAAAAIKDDPDKREQYEVRAVKLLTQLQAQGFFKPSARVQHLKNDEDFVGIRQRDDYRQLLAELERAVRTEPPKKP